LFIIASFRFKNLGLYGDPDPIQQKSLSVDPDPVNLDR